jgi:hypothetical protein
LEWREEDCEASDDGRDEEYTVEFGEVTEQTNGKERADEKCSPKTKDEKEDSSTS